MNKKKKTDFTDFNHMPANHLRKLSKTTPAALSHAPAPSGTASPSRLGRGLSMLLGDNASASQHTPDIAIDRIIPGPFQPRREIEPEELEKLSQSIKENGVLQPVLARPHPEKAGFYELIAGERRFRASKLANLTKIPVHIRRLGEKEALAAALVENLQRANLNPIEEAEGLERMRSACHLSQAEIAKIIGKSRSRIANNLRLLSLPEAVKEKLRDGTITQGHGIALLSCPDPEAALEKVLALSLNVRQTEALAAQADLSGSGVKTHPPQKTKEALKKQADRIAKSLQKTLGLEKFGFKASVQLKAEGKKGGTLKLSWKNQEELEKILEQFSETK